MEPVDYTKIFEASLNEIYVFSAETLKFIEVNRGARENLGYTLEQLRTMTPLDLKPEYTLEIFKQMIAPLVSGEEEKISFETIHLRADGSHYPVEVHLHTTYLEGIGQVFVAIILDITERKLAQKRELEMKLENERTRLLTEFINQVSHEFRTPLAIISSSAHLMVHQENVERRQFKADKIQFQVTQIVKLVETLLAIATLETNLLSHSQVNICNLLQDAYDEMLRLCPDGPMLRYEVAPILPLINGHYANLFDAIMHILDNARRFTSVDGYVVLRAYMDHGAVVIHIEDNGIGISEEDQEHVFETFWRHDSAHTTPGLGLGLSLVHKIIKLHGGQITVTSRLDVGTTFRIELPITSEMPIIPRT